MPTDTIFNLSKNSIKPDNKQDCIKLALVSWHLKKKWHFQEPNDSISWFRGLSRVCWRFSEYLSKRISNGLMGQMSQMLESIILGPRSKPNPLNFFCVGAVIYSSKNIERVHVRMHTLKSHLANKSHLFHLSHNNKGVRKS